MSTATIEVYRTESGSVYEVADGRVRRAHATDVEEWQPYTAINRIPAALFRPGTHGEVLEILLHTGDRVYTSRLILPA